MINIRTLRKLGNNDGITLKGGKIVTYKTGYQVATEGVEVNNVEEIRAIVKKYGGNCGIWYNEGTYYIDKCHRVKNKMDAIKAGKQYNQLSIYDWKFNKLIWM